jgi:hypothetical protein
MWKSLIGYPVDVLDSTADRNFGEEQLRASATSSTISLSVFWFSIPSIYTSHAGLMMSTLDVADSWSIPSTASFWLFVPKSLAAPLLVPSLKRAPIDSTSVPKRAPALFTGAQLRLLNGWNPNVSAGIAHDHFLHPPSHGGIIHNAHSAEYAWIPLASTMPGVPRPKVNIGSEHNRLASLAKNRRMLLGMERFLLWPWNGFSQ